MFNPKSAPCMELCLSNTAGVCLSSIKLIPRPRLLRGNFTVFAVAQDLSIADSTVTYFSVE